MQTIRNKCEWPCILASHWAIFCIFSVARMIAFSFTWCSLIKSQNQNTSNPPLPHFSRYNLFNQSVALFNSIMIGSNWKSIRFWRKEMGVESWCVWTKIQFNSSRNGFFYMYMRVSIWGIALDLADWHFYCVHLKCVPLLAQHAQRSLCS